jgi:hypothetical protein
VPKKENINLHYLLGLLNSKFMNWYYQTILNPEKGEVLAQVKRGHLALLPVKMATAKTQNEIIKLVDQLLQLNKEIQQTRLPNKIEQLQSRIDFYEQKINETVYRLYGLTKDEIEIIEQNK